jgi:hypothetical protein
MRTTNRVLVILFALLGGLAWGQQQAPDTGSRQPLVFSEMEQVRGTLGDSGDSGFLGEKSTGRPLATTLRDSSTTILLDHWAIYPNPGQVGEPVHIEAAIYNSGASAVTISELRLEFLGPLDTEICHQSWYDITLESGWDYFGWIDCAPLRAGYHYANILGLEDGIWKTYSSAWINVVDNTPVVANFSLSETIGPAPLSVQFSDLSAGNIIYWSWNFGDGETSTEQNPVHVYAAEGMYSVSLTVSNGTNSDAKTLTDVVAVVGDECLTGFLPSSWAINMFTVGNLGYLADLNEGLKVIDLSDPDHPLVVGTLATDSASNVYVTGGLAYVADGNSGLKIIDVTDPEAPVLVGSIDTSGAQGVFVRDSYAYVADGPGGLRVIDVSDPASPSLIGNLPTSTALDVIVSESYAYLADRTGGLKVINVSDPTAPFLVTTIPLFYVYSLDLAADRLYVAASNNGLRIYDVSTPATPLAMGHIYFNGYVDDVVVDGGLAYLSESFGVRIVDVSDPYSPLAVGHVVMTDNQSVCLAGDHVCVTQGVSIKTFPKTCGVLSANFAADVTSGPAALTVQFTDQSIGDFTSYAWSFGDGGTSTAQNPSHEYLNPGTYTVSLTVDGSTGSATKTRYSMIEVVGQSCFVGGNYYYLQYSNDIAISGNRAFVADGTNGVEVFYTGNPQYPSRTDSVLTVNALGVDAVGSFAYVADGSEGLKIIDASTDSLYVSGAVDTNYATDVTVAGGYAYVADGPVGMTVIDVSNPTSPYPVGVFDTYNAVDVAVAGTRAYVADKQDGIKIFDISNPAAAVQLGALDTYYALGIKVVGSLAYVADGAEGIKIIDVSDPASPSLVGSLDSVNAQDVFLDGSIAYLADGSGGLKAVDVSSPAAPVLVGSAAIPDAQAVACIGGYSFVADGNSGLLVFDNDCLLYALSANFVPDVWRGAPPLTVHFSDQSLGAVTSYAWDFGDGATSSEANPVHVYAGAGIYTVSLTVTNTTYSDTFVRTNCIVVGDGVSAVGDTPAVLALDANYPNPFNPQTTIGYSLPRTQRVSLVIYDLKGQAVATLVDGTEVAGPHSVVWNGRDDRGRNLGSGVYFYRLITAEETRVRKMLLLK